MATLDAQSFACPTSANVKSCKERKYEEEVGRIAVEAKRLVEESEKE